MFAKLSVQSCASFDRVAECGLVHILEYFILVHQSVWVEDCVGSGIHSIDNTLWLYTCTSVCVEDCLVEMNGII